MRTTRQLATNAQSHTPAVAVSSAPLEPCEQKCTRGSCWFMHGWTQSNLLEARHAILSKWRCNGNDKPKLREYRQRAGLPLEVLAYKARVSPRTLWRWERWNCTPRSWESIQRVAAVLGVQPEDLLDDEQGGER
jgi:DNA-binding XRE family transcriptional regulator